MTDFDLGCASHSNAILHANLAASPLLAQQPLHVERGAVSAGAAYNRLIDSTDAPVIVLANHDVYLPQGWDRLLVRRLAELARIDPDWALFGAFGVGLDAAPIGPVWSSSLGQIVGRVPMQPTAVQSFDELLIVVNRASGLRFDETLPGWHFYGTDIVTQARARGLTAYAGSLPCIHNDRFHAALGQDFADAYRHQQIKWRDRLPLRSPITKISRSGLHLMRDRWRARGTQDLREHMAIGTDHAPAYLAERCGWADLTPLG